MKRIKLHGPAIKSRAEADAVLGDVRAATIDRNRRLLDIELARKAVEEAHAEVLTELSQQIESGAERLRAWAEAHPSEFGSSKGLELTHGTIGWRTGMPTLKTLAGRTWDAVLEALRDIAPCYIRHKEEVDKRQLLAERDIIGVDKLKLIGVRVVQDEPFFVEPKVEEPENRTTTA